MLLWSLREETNNLALLNEEKAMPRLQDNKGSPYVWYFDKGASNHMTGDRKKFSTLDKLIQGQVRFGDGSTMRIEGKVQLCLNLKMENKGSLHMFIIFQIC